MLCRCIHNGHLYCESCNGLIGRIWQAKTTCGVPSSTREYPSQPQHMPDYILTQEEDQSAKFSLHLTDLTEDN